MELKAQDVVVVLKLLTHDGRSVTFAKLGEDLAISPSHAFEAVARAEASHLLIRRSAASAPRRGFVHEANRGNLKEFLIHGVKYAFPVERGGPTRGIPTAEAAPPLDQHFSQDFPLPPVWPYAEGSVRGIAFSPLYKNVPQAAVRDAKLYELLALVDAIREGRAREREMAIRELTARIDSQ
jgi:DNA-binding Lrp family transcriptional regulator